MSQTTPSSWLSCLFCQKQYDLQTKVYLCSCNNLLWVERAEGWLSHSSTSQFDKRLGSREILDQSGVWRFREAILSVPREEIITHPEGGTHLYSRKSLSSWSGLESLFFKHEGENPTGSFKDRGMTVAVTQARRLGAKTVACASTGNTSASLAAYAAQADLQAIVFLPAGQVARGKLLQTLAYGASCISIQGDFDQAMQLVSEASKTLPIHLLNSTNPFRIEGQKTIVWELLQNLSWHAPDWIILPAGNLGNTSAFGKALREAYEGGWIQTLPKIAAIQASGASPFYQSFSDNFQNRKKVKANTLASAIKIGNPVRYEHARIAIEYTHGLVEQVSDLEILQAKRKIDKAGIGCEPASACSLAGAKKLRENGTIQAKDRVVCILTGNLLKDIESIDASLREEPSQVLEIPPNLTALEKALAELNAL